MSTKILFDKKISDLGKLLKKEKHLIIITDRTVKRLYGKEFPKAQVLVIKEGEKRKNLTTVYGLMKRLLKMGADRESFIVGIGGGIVCDVTGFVASTFMRGVRFGFVPTTLLSMVDASIGGKNGVNLKHYKNIVGVINQPEFVYYDLAVLNTLPEKALKCGFAEAVKHSIISGETMTGLPIKKIIKSSIKTKTNIVKSDVNDHGKRHALNLGHTLGHSIEAVTRGKISHGQAVAIGICFSARYSHSLGILKKDGLDEIINVIGSLGLPTELPKKISKVKILDAIKKDKKKDQKQIELVLIKGIGKVVFKKFEIDKIKEAVYALC